MFDRLIESRHVRRWSPAQMLFAFAIHLLIIAGALRLTRAVAASVSAASVPVTAIYSASPRAASPSAGRASARAAVAPAPVPTFSPPAGPVAVVVPPNLIGATQPAGSGSPKAAFAPQGLPADPGTPDGITSGNVVDIPARYLSGPHPAYPPLLKRLRITGIVTLRYIVEPDSSVDRRTVVVVSSTGEAFDAPAIDAIVHAKFSPAYRRGVAVRQLVEQSVRFDLKP